MRRIILDTNVLVSGLFWSGVPNKILEAWENKNLQLVFSQAIFDEYTRIAHALARKHNACQSTDVSMALELVMINGELATSISLNQQICSDPDDDKFIACAIGANCEMIVSGDKHLLDVNGYAGISILKPADFWHYFLNSHIPSAETINAMTE